MAFMNMMMTGNPDAVPTQMPGMGGMGGMGGQGTRPAQRRPPGSIQVTQAEMDSIQRLESLGFEKS